MLVVGANIVLLCLDLVLLDSTSPLPYLPLPTLSSVDAVITPVFGRLTCTLKMEVYKGPFEPLRTAPR